MKQTKKYYAVVSNEDAGVYHSGLNALTPLECAMQFLELKVGEVSAKEEKEYRALLAKVGPEKFVEHFNCTLENQEEPFIGD